MLPSVLDIVFHGIGGPAQDWLKMVRLRQAVEAIIRKLNRVIQDTFEHNESILQCWSAYVELRQRIAVLEMENRELRERVHDLENSLDVL